MADKVRKIGIELTLENEAKWKKAMQESERGLKNIKSELTLNTAAFDGNANSVDALTAKQELLERQHEQQTEKVRALRQALEYAETQYGETSKQADGYRQSLNYAETALEKTNTAIKDNAKYLAEAESSADGCARSIDGYGREVKNSGDETDGLLGKLNGLIPGLDMTKLKAGLTGTAIAGAFKAAWDWAMNLIDSTEELRDSLAKLDATASNAGMEVDDKLTGALRTCYEVTGEMDSAFEALSNLIEADYDNAGMVKILDSLSGAVVAFPDTLKIESLADSLQETLATGKATGQFEETLGRLGADVDDFNTKLAANNDLAWRQNIVFETLAETGIDEVAATYRDAAGSSIELRDAQFELEMANARLAESLVPLKTKWTETRANWSDNIAAMLSGAQIGGGLLKSMDLAIASGAAAGDQKGLSTREVVETLKEAGLTFQEFYAAADRAGVSVGEYINQLAAATEETNEAAGASVNYAAMLAEDTAAVESANEKLAELQATYDSLTQNVDNAVSGFTDMTAAMEGNATTADDMVAALQSQIDYLSSYEENLRWAADMGLSDALIQELSDGSVQSAAYLAAIVEDGGQSIEELNTKFADVSQGKEDFVEAVAGLLPGFQETLDEVTSELDAAIDDWNMYSEAKIAGTDTMSGLEDGIAGRLGALYSLGQRAYNAFQGGYRAAADQHSPSRKARKLMGDTVDGFVVEGERRLADMASMGRQLSGAVMSGYSSAAPVAGNTALPATGMGAVAPMYAAGAPAEITFRLEDNAGRIIAQASASEIDSISGTEAQLKARGLTT